MPTEYCPICKRDVVLVRNRFGWWPVILLIIPIVFLIYVIIYYLTEKKHLCPVCQRSISIMKWEIEQTQIQKQPVTQSISIMTCPFCGNAILGKVPFCPHCGTQI